MIFETAAVLIFSSVGYVLVRLVSGFQGIGVCWGLVNVVLLLLLWLLKKGVGGWIPVGGFTRHVCLKSLCECVLFPRVLNFPLGKKPNFC